MSTDVMRGPGRHKNFAPRSRFGPVAIAVMVAFHGLVAWALVTGLGQQVIGIVKKPLDATIIQEVKVPPPPPEPPKPIAKEVPKLAPAPPAYVPPPDVTPPVVEVAPTIAAVQNAEPVAPPPPAPAMAEAPPAPPTLRRQDIAVACPKQVRPEIPPRAVADGISGTVRVELRVVGTKVIDVKIVSGPRIFHNAVRAALAQYACQTGGGEEVIATQEFEFRIE